jgi:hypothetical protein
MVNRIISIDIYAQLGWSRSARQAVAEGSQLLAALRWRPKLSSARTPVSAPRTGTLTMFRLLPVGQQKARHNTRSPFATSGRCRLRSCPFGQGGRNQSDVRLAGRRRLRAARCIRRRFN